jgi:hypothetical protein
MTSELMSNPQHWRERAEEARTNAEQINDPEAKRLMLGIAASYERLALRAEERVRGGSPKRTARAV